MKKLIAASLLLCLSSLAIAAAPDFSGNYVLDLTTVPATTGARQRAPIAIVNIEQTAGTLVITEWYDKKNKVDSFECTTDGKCGLFNRNERTSSPVTLSFDNGDLVIRTSADLGGRVLRRFSLSSDKKTLTVKELQNSPASLVYRRE